MGKFIDLTNLQFGRLKVERLEGRSKHGHSMWLCVCTCGNNTLTSTGDLKSSKTVSCGCHRRDSTIERNTKHAKSKVLAYSSWKAMKTRCYNKKVKSYLDYGGRGITICDRWLNSFENFLADMGERPDRNHSIERLERDGNYTPDNCKWATKKEQNRNTRQNHLLDTQWGRITLAEASEKSGIKLGTLKRRLRKGTPESELLKPVK